jgi:hypothetical protein
LIPEKVPHCPVSNISCGSLRAPSDGILDPLNPNPHAEGVPALEEVQVIGSGVVISCTYIEIVAVGRHDAGRLNRKDSTSNDNGTRITSRKKDEVGGDRHYRSIHER